MRTSILFVVALGLAFGDTSSASAGHWWHSFCCYKQTCDSCQECPNVCHTVGCHMCLRVACLDSTCDMYQHYPYYPECHGSYYFRPYNWEHYAQDTSLMLGMGHVAPYSEDGLHELKPVSVSEQPLIKVRQPKLPSIEAILADSATLPPPPRPVP